MAYNNRRQFRNGRRSRNQAQTALGRGYQPYQPDPRSVRLDPNLEQQAAQVFVSQLRFAAGLQQQLAGKHQRLFEYAQRSGCQLEVGEACGFPVPKAINTPSGRHELPSVLAYVAVGRPPADLWEDAFALIRQHVDSTIATQLANNPLAWRYPVFTRAFERVYGPAVSAQAQAQAPAVSPVNPAYTAQQTLPWYQTPAPQPQAPYSAPQAATGPAQALRQQLSQAMLQQPSQQQAQTPVDDTLVSDLVQRVAAQVLRELQGQQVTQPQATQPAAPAEPGDRPGDSHQVLQNGEFTSEELTRAMPVSHITMRQHVIQAVEKARNLRLGEQAGQTAQELASLAASAGLRYKLVLKRDENGAYSPVKLIVGVNDHVYLTRY